MERINLTFCIQSTVRVQWNDILILDIRLESQKMSLRAGKPKGLNMIAKVDQVY